MASSLSFVTYLRRSKSFVISITSMLLAMGSNNVSHSVRERLVNVFGRQRHITMLLSQEGLANLAIHFAAEQCQVRGSSSDQSCPPCERRHATRVQTQEEIDAGFRYTTVVLYPESALREPQGISV